MFILLPVILTYQVNICRLHLYCSPALFYYFPFKVQNLAYTSFLVAFFLSPPGLPNCQLKLRLFFSVFGKEMQHETLVLDSKKTDQSQSKET